MSIVIPEMLSQIEFEPGGIGNDIIETCGRGRSHRYDLHRAASAQRLAEMCERVFQGDDACGKFDGRKIICHAGKP
ncbi:hypothetical protein JJB99_21350 [Bradyrhizobium diazoefficiens]|uniref:hypothetical protein n=1 Tax=Bradyrhizobium diazoefficiens TaxID=1355477 RepID=UPI00190B056A|nr:hypothetical protein [Bradyrhizobium diazoefficiens]QQO12038.1 hypothetical protein JJB99_21350 [Bradyrhizobium diazoefficiens]